MLCLSRKPGEKIYVGDVVIEVLRFGKDGVRLGIDAPSDVPIWRGELRDKMEANGEPIRAKEKGRKSPPTPLPAPREKG